MTSSCIAIRRPRVVPRPSRERRDGRRTEQEVRALLHEIAYVLHVTRKVRADILRS